MPTATRSDFLTGATRRYTTFTCPVSGLVARIQSLTEAESAAIEIQGYERDPLTEQLRRDESGRLIRKESAITDSRALMIIATLVDDAGKLLFAAGDLELVRDMDSGDTLPLYDAILEHCRPGEKKNPRRADQPPAADAADADGSDGGLRRGGPGEPSDAGTDGSMGSV